MHRLVSFWPLQAGGWFGYAFVSAVTIWPFRHEHGAIAFRAIVDCGEFLSSFVLYGFCRALWRRSIPLVHSLISCALLSYILGIASFLPALWEELHVRHESMALFWRSAFAGGVGAAFVLIAWSALYFGIKHSQTVETQRVLLLESEASARSAQLQALQYQLQPHFLFNTLNAISSLVFTEQTAQATTMLSKLGTLLRSTLEQPDVFSITLDQELAVVEEYLDIEKVRFASRLRVTQDVQTEARSAYVPRFLLQPIVENAIRHGIARRPLGGTVGIRAFAFESRLYIEIDNDLAESRIDSKQMRGGLGLSNSRARLEKLYSKTATLTTYRKDGRFIVAIILPLISSVDALLD